MTLPVTDLDAHLSRLVAAKKLTSAFRARTSAGAAEWQRETRDQLARSLGVAGREPPAGASTLVGTRDRGGWLEESRLLDVGEGLHAPFFVLVPKQPPPHKPVLVFAGHDLSARICIGHFEADDAAESAHRADNAYAVDLVRRGYLVGVIDQRGMGDWLTSQVDSSEPPRSCRHLALAYAALGRTLMGERCRDGQQAATHLLSRADVAAETLGCVGHSGGGAAALWLAALDPRIGVVAVSGYFCSFRDSIYAREHCTCNYVPDVSSRMEMGDLAAMIAPRRFCAVNGRMDPLFPWDAAAREFETVQRTYALMSARGAAQLVLHEDGHAYRGDLVERWLEKWM